MQDITSPIFSSSSQALIMSYGAMTSVMDYLSILERIHLQAVCKRFYSSLIPQIIAQVEIPNISLLLERSRKDIQIAMWKRGDKKLKTRRLLKIGSDDREDKPEKLGFSELYFQWLV